MSHNRIFLALPGCLALLFLVSVLYAQEAGSLRVSISSFPDYPAAGEYWTLTLRIEYPFPEDVTVLTPPFAASVFLDKTVKSARFDPETEEHWTEVEYSFLLNNPGIHILDPFTVIGPNGQIQTEPVVADVHNAAAVSTVRRPVLSWVGTPAKMQIGEAASFYLRISGWDSTLPFPPSGFFMPSLVEGAIIEDEKRSGEDPEAQVLRLKLIPLKAASFVFPERTVVYNNIPMRIPGFSVAVSSPPLRDAPDMDGTISENSLNDNDGFNKVPFPEFETPLSSGGLYRLVFRRGFAFFGAAYENIYRSAENIWNQGYYADALAMLRRNERDIAFGPLFLTIRRQAEQNLGLYHTGDEAPRRLFFSLSVFCFSLVFLITLIYVIRSAVRKKWLTALAVLLAFSLTQVLYFGIPVNRYSSESYRPAVLKQTGVRLVPDTSGEFAARFREGQPVKVPGKKGFTHQEVSWLWVQANDQGGLAGWVPEDSVVFY